jgi:hypothetical protein
MLLQVVELAVQTSVDPAGKAEFTQLAVAIPRLLVESENVNEKAPLMGLVAMLSIVTV